MNVRSLAIASLVAGLLITILSSLPVISWGNCLACMWLWMGGIFGAWLYSRFEGTITGGQGAVVGFFAGLLGAILAAIIGTVLGGALMAGVIGPQMETAEEVLGTSIFSFLLSGASSGLQLLCTAFLFPVFGTLGGAIGGVIFSGQKSVA